MGIYIVATLRIKGPVARPAANYGAGVFFLLGFLALGAILDMNLIYMATAMTLLVLLGLMIVLSRWGVIG